VSFEGGDVIVAVRARHDQPRAVFQDLVDKISSALLTRDLRQDDPLDLSVRVHGNFVCYTMWWLRGGARMVQLRLRLPAEGLADMELMPETFTDLQTRFRLVARATGVEIR
jgi:hypothetical protein